MPDILTQKECYDKNWYSMKDCPGCHYNVDCHEGRFGDE